MSGLFPILALALIAASIGAWLWWSNRPMGADWPDLDGQS